jgi:hypothetical protein
MPTAKKPAAKKPLRKAKPAPDIPTARRHDIAMAMHSIYEARKRIKRDPDGAREWLDTAQDLLDSVLSGAPSIFE